MEKIESLNNQLADLYGRDTITNLPIWRIVWAPDQLEKQLGDYDDYTESGVFIRSVHEVREIRKYDWVNDKWVLERLELVPEIHEEELLGAKIAYNLIWAFEDKNGFPIQPSLEVCQFLIDVVHAAMGKKNNLPKYKKSNEELAVDAINRYNKIYEGLWGNEDYVADKLAVREGVFIPNKEN